MTFLLINLLVSFLTYSPGQTVPEEVIMEKGAESFFSEAGIPDDVFRLMEGRSYKKDCTVPRDSLRYILCLHRDADGKAIVGEMVVGRKIAGRVLKILYDLFLASYPIERMRLVDHWDADDGKSMSANNSSSFNFRFISHTTTVSSHGMGLAVDINPLYNPYVKKLRDGTILVEPDGALGFTDRSRNNPYMIKADDLCCRLFKENGFVWGGDWKSCKDYQHFEFVQK